MDKKITSWLPLLILFSGTFIFFGFFADYVEFYQEKLSLFIFTGDFFRENITQPGSLLVYSGKFLSTFYYYPVAGSLVISLIITLIVYLMSVILSNLSGIRPTIIPFIAGILLVFLQADYQFLIVCSFGLLLQLVFVWILLKLPKGYLPFFLFPIWYMVTGNFAIIAALMYMIILAKRPYGSVWIRIIIIPAVILITIWILKQFILFQPLSNLAFYPLSDESTGSQLWLYLITTGIIVTSPLTANLKIKHRLFANPEDSVRGYIGNALLLISLLAIFIFKFDRVNKEYFKVQKLFFSEKYEELTKYLTLHPTSNRLTIYLNNIALCETGRLNDRLFWLPQSPDGQSLFLKWEMYAEVLKLGGYFYYTTGMINEAHRWAFENMVMRGIAPEDLKMLIKTEVINGNYKMASKYISILKSTLFYRKEALAFEKLVGSEEMVESDPELGRKRKEQIENDFFSITDNPYINIERVFSADPLNRKVFDYRMAYLMITENYQELASGIGMLKGLGYSKIPLHLEEAALVCRMSGSVAISGLGDLRINPQTESRFSQFLETFRQYGNNLKTAQPFLKQKFGNTFWYWAFYH
jgi:hypothetical protein